ncbi:pyroglutamyl-peptidase I [Posidoniimonas polymericola]|nr:pyroglutamyl-peptidase I [Posidoniimonas polymericola]
MVKILITAYGPYDDWPENASWLALQAFLRDLPDGVELTTRLYPVDFQTLRSRLEPDLAEGHDAVLHLGQAPGAARIELETIGLNIGRERGAPPSEDFPLASDGPLAYRSGLPLPEWEALLRCNGIPAAVSYHAGEYLCNAALYLTHYFNEQAGRPTSATFLHLPLDTSQVVDQGRDAPSLPAEESARAIRLIIADLQQRRQYVGEQAGIA